MRSQLSREEAERLVQTYSDLILRLSFTYLKNTEDAKDICQTVFLRLLEKPREFQSPEHERAWIIRTSVNVCKDQLKSSWRRTTVDLSAALDARAPEAEEGSLWAAVALRAAPALRTLMGFVRSSLLVSLNPGALCPHENRTQVTTICAIKKKNLNERCESKWRIRFIRLLCPMKLFLII